MIKVMIKFLGGSLLPVFVFGLVNLTFNHDVKQTKMSIPSQKITKAKSEKLIEENQEKILPSTDKVQDNQDNQDNLANIEPPVYVTDELPHTGEVDFTILSKIGYLILGSILLIKGRKQQSN